MEVEFITYWNQCICAIQLFFINSNQNKNSFDTLDQSRIKPEAQIVTLQRKATIKCKSIQTQWEFSGGMIPDNVKYYGNDTLVISPVLLVNKGIYTCFGVDRYYTYFYAVSVIKILSKNLFKVWYS